jgi:histidine triad (HIT) family protein
VPLVLPAESPCAFCEDLAGARPCTILDRDDLVALIVPHQQRGQGHVLVIPIEHRVTILDLTAPERAAVMDATVRVAMALTDAFDPEGIAVWQNNGVPAFQSVPHVHVHVAGTLPGGGTDWGDTPRLSGDEADAIAEQIRPHLRLPR